VVELIEVADLSASIVNRLLVDAEGASVRAAVGTYADPNTGAQIAGVIHARHLASEARRPTNPFIAYREGPLILTDVSVQLPTFRMFLYDAPAQGYWRINKLATLLSRAYKARPITIPLALIGPVQVTDLSSAMDDPVLGLLMRYVTVSMRALT
jgi:hypothetical protein